MRMVMLISVIAFKNIHFTINFIQPSSQDIIHIHAFSRGTYRNRDHDGVAGYYVMFYQAEKVLSRHDFSTLYVLRED